MSLVFFAAGVSKLRHSGLAWIFSDNMAVLLIQANYHISNADPLLSWWSLWIAQHVWLCQLFAAATIVTEVGYPLALFGGWARWFFPISMCGLLLGIHAFMGPTFSQFILCHLFWVPWARRRA